jgi:DNA-directed RNA polymerase beta subunit
MSKTTFAQLKRKIDSSLSIDVITPGSPAGVDEIQDEEVWAIINSFVEQNGLNSAQLHSFNDFIHNGIWSVLNIPNIKHTRIEYNGKKYEMEISEYHLLPPRFTEVNGESHTLYPMEALWRNTTYASEIYIDVNIILPSGESTFCEKIYIGNIPVLVKSDLCNVSLISDDIEELASHSEDPLDYGGYFVISSKGESSSGGTAQRRVLVSQERIANNQIFMFKNRKNSPKFNIYAECHSTLTGIHKTTTSVGRIQNRISCILPWIDGVEIPVGILFKAFGVEMEKDMVILILGPNYEKDVEALNIIIPVLEYSYECSTRESALHFIGRRGRKFMKDDSAAIGDDVGDADVDSFGIDVDGGADSIGENNTFFRQTKDRDSAISYAKHLLSVEVFSHIGQGESHSHDKAMFLGYMIKKLIYVIMGRSKPENRDHYMNKRINTTGILLRQQFHSAMRRIIMEITNSTLKALRQGRNVNIISWIKPSILTNAMQGAISNNTWNINGGKSKGISQIYEQYNYAAGIASMRKLSLPIDGEGGKITEPRDLQGVHFGIMCVTGDTMVTMADGSLQEIKSFNGTEEIMTINQDTLEPVPSKIHSLFSAVPMKLICIETVQGFKLKCTADHPILTVTNFALPGEESYIWKNASDIQKSDIILFYRRGYEKPIGFYGISKVYEIPVELVYDFTTVSSNHSFIANGFVTHNCPAETPEGKSVGLIRNLALLCYITVGSDPAPVAHIISSLIGINHINEFPQSLDWTRIFLNGTPMGAVLSPKKFVDEMRKLRRSANINAETSIAYHQYSNEIHVSTEEGRPCRPLIIVQDGEILLKMDIIESLVVHDITWSELLEQGTVELVDKAEEESAFVVGYPSHLQNMANDMKIKVTHCELHPSMMYGIGGSIIPFPNFNQSPRNCYQASMGKQAVGIPFTNYRQMLTGSFSTLRYLQVPLAITRSATIIGFDEMPSGQNAMILIMPMVFNEEDSMEINQDSIDRGFMGSDKWVCYRADKKKERGEIFGVPTEETCERFRGNAGKLNEKGFTPKGTRLEAGDLIIGKLVEVKQDAGTTGSGIAPKKKYISISVKYEHPWPAMVDMVQIGRTGDGYEYISVMTVQVREPIVGDKLAVRHGQKGIIGKKRRAIDLPFNRNGNAPDVVMNSIAFPSRMTIAMLIETWSGKAVSSTSPLHEVRVADMVANATDSLENYNDDALENDDPEVAYDGSIHSDFTDMFSHPKHKHLVDATPFRKYNRSVIKEEMSKTGFALGDEYWTNGITGKMTRCLAFYGPCFIQRLKHMVVDKVHARARGAKTMLTRQPKEGRILGGGLRIGTMERDCMLGQGAAKFVRDRLMEQSDEFRTWICNICGLPAHVEQAGKIKECRVCGTTDVSKIKIPYGTKLIQQELMAENIIPRILTVRHTETHNKDGIVEDK